MITGIILNCVIVYTTVILPSKCTSIGNHASVEHGTDYYYGSNEDIDYAYDNHTCYRNCSLDPSQTMECHYEFVLHHFMTNSVHCKKCTRFPFTNDCYNEGCIPGDGTKRLVALVNNQMPGPSIRLRHYQVCQGDKVIVDVRNQLTEFTSIHWHGIHQMSTNGMDGVPGITQCAIPPDQTFRYEFTVNAAGTYFWHAFSGYQRADGIYGSLIVRKALEMEQYGPLGGRNQKLYDFDLPEHEMILMDWQRQHALETLISSKYGDEQLTPHNILVNGKGLSRGQLESNTQLYPSRTIPVHQVNVEQGKGYRLRFISNGVMACPIEISIENHTMTVIATDGYDLEKQQVNSLVIYPGERWDVVIKADQATPGSAHWIRFRGLNICAVQRVYQLGVLHYLDNNGGSSNAATPAAYNVRPVNVVGSWKDAGSLSPSGDHLQLNAFRNNRACQISASQCRPRRYMNVTELKSLHDPDRQILRATAPDQYYMAFDFSQTGSGRGNRRTYVGGSPIYNCQRLATNEFVMTNRIKRVDVVNHDGDNRNCSLVNNNCKCNYVVKIRLNSIVELILIDPERTLNSSHSFHMHGHSFRVLGMGQLRPNASSIKDVKQLHQRGHLLRKTVGAPIKDNVIIPEGGYTIIKFRANNPGFWYFHCFTEFRLDIGMGITFQVGDITTNQQTPASQHCQPHNIQVVSPTQTTVTTTTARRTMQPHSFTLNRRQDAHENTDIVAPQSPTNSNSTPLQHGRKIQQFSSKQITVTTPLPGTEGNVVQYQTWLQSTTKPTSAPPSTITLCRGGDIIDSSVDTGSIFYNKDDNHYYWVYAKQDKVFIRKSPEIINLSSSKPKMVYDRNVASNVIRNPIIHNMNGSYWLYFDLTKAPRNKPERRLHAVFGGALPDSNYTDIGVLGKKRTVINEIEGYAMATKIIERQQPTAKEHYLLWSTPVDLKCTSSTCPQQLVMTKFENPMIAQQNFTKITWPTSIGSKYHQVINGRNGFSNSIIYLSPEGCLIFYNIGSHLNPMIESNWIKKDVDSSKCNITRAFSVSNSIGRLWCNIYNCGNWRLAKT